MVKSLHFIFQIWVKGENCRRNVKKEVGNIGAGSCSSELQTKVNCEPVSEFVVYNSLYSIVEMKVI